ncbi:substrate-binding domain-containing protein [Pseudomonas sp. F-14 TE3623]
MESLRAIREAFPHLAVSFSTEGLGGAERRLRNGDAALVLCTLIPTVPDDITALPLLSVDLRPVVASGHPLAMSGRRATSADLKPYVQLVLSDPVSPDSPSYGVTGSHQWRFVDLARRLDFFLAGFGWCRMPEHLIADHLASGRLLPLELTAELQRTPDTLTIYAAHMQNCSLGKAGRWLLNDLTRRLCM